MTRGTTRALLSQTRPKNEYVVEQLKNFLPLIVFVVAYVTTDIYTATAALMIAVTGQVAVYLLLKQPLSMELKITFWVGLIMGSLTLFFRNELFIQWKSTIVNWLLGTVLIGTHFVGKSYGMEVVLKKLLANSAPEGQPAAEAQQAAPRSVWRNVNLIWITSFALAGALNLLVAYNFSLDFWVTYKLLGGFMITLTTVMISGYYLYRNGLLDHLDPDSEAEQNTP